MTGSGTHTTGSHPTGPRDCGCGCGCGKSPTATAPAALAPTAGFRAGGPVRPVFFAGQLLTEDDLGGLATWTTGRVRVHNRLRYVSADGYGAVLCGLSVGCDSCARGTVRVGEGHAVDGAGNDIPVRCAEDVDVVALVREFRATGGGCPDPCPPGPERTYGLFLRYEEEFAEPAAPYDPGDGCATVGCVPTRVREGHRYSVGCVPEPPRDRLCALLRRRFGDDRGSWPRARATRRGPRRTTSPTGSPPVSTSTATCATAVRWPCCATYPPNRPATAFSTTGCARCTPGAPSRRICARPSARSWSCPARAAASPRC